MTPKGYYAPLGSVSLTGRTRYTASPYTENRDHTLSYLRFLDADTMLYSFRRTFGVDTRGAVPPGGWEEPNGLLRGHSLGHFISALSLAFASEGDAALGDKLDYIISELRALQLMSHGDPAAFVTASTPDNVREEDWSRDPSVWGEGYIGAYPPDQFALLEQKTPYNKIWAPYYTLHKLLAGVLECYIRTGNAAALQIARGIGDWVFARLSSVSPEQREEMWSLYIAGEYGGMNESLAELYSLTGDARYLEAARMFDNKPVFDGLAAGVDTIAHKHANQHIPQIIGALAIYEATGDAYYLNVAVNFFDIVTAHHMYATGGVGRGESFFDADALAANIDSDKNCETCAAYNLIKLARMMYALDPDDAKYMDYIERALVNHILPSLSRRRTRDMHAGVTYMLPIGPGARREYSDDMHSFTCCHGTGMENHVKYGESVYFVTERAGRAVVYVNLPVASEFTDAEHGIKLKLDSAFPFPDCSLTLDGDGDYDVMLRVPSWARAEVFGTGAHSDDGDYLLIPHAAGVSETLPFSFTYTARLEYTPDSPDGHRTAALMYGPFVMAALGGGHDYITLHTGGGDIASKLRVSLNREAGAFSLVGFGREFVPMYLVGGAPYHTYFRIEE